ncbi:MAG: hypothetical protein Q9P90_13735 [candidate division KSB1 bacterium]|nr:hypothetical protein [candidate division KSB1 bacterium]
MKILARNLHASEEYEIAILCKFLKNNESSFPGGHSYYLFNGGNHHCQKNLQKPFIHQNIDSKDKYGLHMEVPMQLLKAFCQYFHHYG